MPFHHTFETRLGSKNNVKLIPRLVTVPLVLSFMSDRLFYSCVLCCQAFDVEWDWRWPCCDRDQYLASIITRQFTFWKRQGLCHSKATLSLTSVRRLGNQAHNYKMDCCIHVLTFSDPWLVPKLWWSYSPQWLPISGQ